MKMTVANVLANSDLQHENPEFDQLCDKVIAALETAKNNFTNRNWIYLRNRRHCLIWADVFYFPS